MIELLIAIVSLFAGSALGVVFDRGYKKYEFWSRLRKLCHVLPLNRDNREGDIYIRPSLEILSGGEGGASKRAYTHAGEVIALQDLGRVLHGTMVKLRFRYDDRVDDPKADWIILGLSRKKSTIAQSIFDKMTNEYGIEVVKGSGSHQYFKLGDGSEFRCRHVPDPAYESRVTTDFGIIYRSYNGSGGLILLCGGIHMCGTQAALEVAISADFCRRVKRSRAREFAQIVEVPVLDDGITIDRDGIKWRDLPFVTLAERIELSSSTKVKTATSRLQQR